MPEQGLGVMMAREELQVIQQPPTLLHWTWPTACVLGSGSRQLLLGPLHWRIGLREPAVSIGLGGGSSSVEMEGWASIATMCFANCKELGERLVGGAKSCARDTVKSVTRGVPTKTFATPCLSSTHIQYLYQLILGVLFMSACPPQDLHLR